MVSSSRLEVLSWSFTHEACWFEGAAVYLWGAIFRLLSLFPRQAATLKPYLQAVRSSLTAAMCLENFESQVVERHNKPEVEVRCVSGSKKDGIARVTGRGL